MMLLVTSGQLLAHVQLDYPRGGESFVPGQQIVIQWSELVAHNTENWDLYYSIDGGTTWLDLLLDIPVSTQSQTWTIPMELTTQARIRVVQDNVGGDYDDQSGDFIIGEESQVQLLKPVGGEIFIPGENATIQWAISDPHATENWDLAYSIDGGTSWVSIVEDLASDIRTFDWNVPPLPTMQGQVRIVQDNASEDFIDASGLFTIADTSMKYVSLRHPSGGEVFIGGETITIQWDIDPNHNALGFDLIFTLSDDEDSVQLALGLEPTILEYQWIVPEVQSVGARIHIRQHNAGQDYVQSSEPFTIYTPLGHLQDRQALAVWPNPFSQLSTFTLDDAHDRIRTIEIFSLNGKLIRQFQVDSQQFELTRAGLTNGIYLYRVQTREMSVFEGRLLLD